MGLRLEIMTLLPRFPTLALLFGLGRSIVLLLSPQLIGPPFLGGAYPLELGTLGTPGLLSPYRKSVQLPTSPIRLVWPLSATHEALAVTRYMFPDDHVRPALMASRSARHVTR